MKRKSYLFVIAALLCGAWFWAFWGNGPKEGKASSAVRGDAGKGAVAVSAGKDTVPANSGNDPERFVYDGEHFGSKQAMERAKKQDRIDLYGADAKITLHVTDSSGRNVPDAAVKADFGVFEKSTSTTGKTDGNGIFIWNGRTDGEVVYTVEKDGYYKTRTAYRLNLINGDDVKDGKWVPWGRAIEVTLKEKRNPIPMYAKNAGIRLPKKGETFGFDFMIGDLVAPYGKGEYADVLLRCWGDKPIPLTHTVSRYLRLSWDSGNEGVMRKGRDLQSVFHSLHEAPDSGYEPEINLCYRRTNDKILENNDFPENEYLIFRTRVELGEGGKIIKANYGKIFDIWFDISANDRDGAAVRFLYYFNPNENDRNLEYDGKANLLNPRDTYYAP